MLASIASIMELFGLVQAPFFAIGNQHNTGGPLPSAADPLSSLYIGTAAASPLLKNKINK